MNDLVTALPENNRPPERIIWGSVFAGLALFFALNVMFNQVWTGWSATGSAAVTATVSWSAIAWTLLTVCVATFTGAWLTGRYSRPGSAGHGARLGLVMWAAGVAVTVIFSSGFIDPLVSLRGPQYSDPGIYAEPARVTLLHQSEQRAARISAIIQVLSAGAAMLGGIWGTRGWPTVQSSRQSPTWLNTKRLSSSDSRPRFLVNPLRLLRSRSNLPPVICL